MAGGQIASLYAKIGADTTGLKNGLSEAKKGIGGLVENFTGLKTSSIGVAAVITGVGMAIKDTVVQTVSYAEQVRDLGRISGTSAEQSSRLIQTADDLKVSYETLTMAARTAATKGIALTTENLAKLSDQYLSIQDPAKRAAFALDNFGRAGLEMTKVLEQGGDAIRKMAGEQNSALTLTEKQVKQARDFEIAQDKVNDALSGLKYVIGNAVLPGLTAFLSKINDLIDADERLRSAEADAQKQRIESASTVEDYNQKLDIQIQAVKDTTDATYLLGDGQMDYNQQLEISILETRKMADEQFNLAKGYQNNKKQLEDYADSSQGAFDQLAGGLDALRVAQDKVSDNTSAYLNTVTKPLTQEFIFQKLAVGLEGDALIRFAEKMGMIDSASAAAYSQIEALNRQFQQGAKDTDYFAQQAYKLKMAIDNLQNKTVVVEYLEKYTRENAPGGSGGYIPPSQWGPPSLPQAPAPAQPPYSPYVNNSIVINGANDAYAVARQVQAVPARYQ